MARIKSSSAAGSVGRPGFKRFRPVGGLVNRTKVAKGGVRRLFSRDPSKGAFSQFGTKRDILGFTNDPDVPNVTDAPSPTIVRGSEIARRSVAKGQQKVVNRSANRRVRRTKL